MLIEGFLQYCATRLTRRYLAFEEYTQDSPPQSQKDGRYLLYIHIPFCEELCPYCSFVSIKFEPSVALGYLDAIKKEIEIYQRCGYCFDSVYIGGGTPTILPEKLAGIISFVRDTWPIKQVSVETNPNHLVNETLRILKDVGVNRLSVGVQSFNDKILESIGRLEKYGTGEEIKERLVRIAGMFETLNIDMIFNFPNQTEEILAEDIRAIKESKVNQITYYPLMVSEYRKNEISKRCGEVNYRQEKKLYQQIVEGLTEAYEQESVWCFSNKKGAIDEYIIDYDDYVGVGRGAFGYINGTMYSNTFSIDRYIKRAQEGKHSILAYRRYSYIERMRYDFLIRLLYGTLELSYMKRKYGKSYWFYLLRELLFFSSTRAVKFRDGKIVLTEKGRNYWLILMRTLFSMAGDYRERRAKLDTAGDEN